MSKSSLVCLALLMLAPHFAHAAQSYDNCVGFIDTVPAVISTQGTWCLRHDLGTAITSGNAVTVATSNVTIDCNDFKLGDLAAGTGTQAIGIQATNQLNITIRQCNVRGFYIGMRLQGSGGGGHTVEDNRLDDNTSLGMDVEGDGSVVRRNRVLDTGGSTVAASAAGILTYRSVDLLDNTVSGVSARTGSNGYAQGIIVQANPDGQITGNRVRGLAKDGTGSTLAIASSVSGAITLSVNAIDGDSSVGSVGIQCSNTAGRARDNEISGFAIGISGCANVSGNDIH